MLDQLRLHFGAKVLQHLAQYQVADKERLSVNKFVNTSYRRTGDLVSRYLSGAEREQTWEAPRRSSCDWF